MSRLAAAIGLLVLAACPGSLQNPERFRADFCLFSTEQLFEKSCAVGGCHSTDDAEGELDMEAADFGQRILGVEASAAMDADCTGEGLIINPDDPPASLLYRKLTDNAICGDQMPVIGCCVSGIELDCVLEWIAFQKDADSMMMP